MEESSETTPTKETNINGRVHHPGRVKKQVPAKMVSDVVLWGKFYIFLGVDVRRGAQKRANDQEILKHEVQKVLFPRARAVPIP